MHQPPPPQTLDYQDPHSQRRPMSWGQFWAGIFIGLAFSVIYYLFLGNSGNMFASAPFAAFGAVITKLVVGIVLGLKPRWKGLGIGLITSIPVAIMIFFGLCFALIAGMRWN